MVPEPPVPPQEHRQHAEVTLTLHDICAEISRLKQTNDSMRLVIDRSLAHLREMYAFLQTLEPRRMKPAVHLDGHPVCCDVPMWLTMVQISADLRCGQYTCQICGRTIDGTEALATSTA